MNRIVLRDAVYNSGAEKQPSARGKRASILGCCALSSLVAIGIITYNDESLEGKVSKDKRHKGVAYIPREPSGLPSYDSRGYEANGQLVAILRGVPSAGSYGASDAEGQVDSRGVRRHMAVDWFAPARTPVRAPIDGTIARITEDHGCRSDNCQVYGGVLSIRDRSGRLWVMRHINPANNLKVGDRVEAGQNAGGVSAWSGDTHIHFELYRAGSQNREYNGALAINPIKAYQQAGLLKGVVCKYC